VSELTLVPLDRLEFGLQQRPWPFAEQRRAEIAAHFAERQRLNPALWNGRVLILREHAFEGRCLRGTFSEVDYASYRTWIDWGYPEAGTNDCFAVAALRSADGAFLMGVMAPHTANAGLIYFPTGAPEASDLTAEGVDLGANVWRELREETGLGPSDVTGQPGWSCTLAGARLPLFKRLQAREAAEPLRARILSTLARQHQPELSDIRIVRGPDDLDPLMPDYVIAFVRDAWR